MKKIIILFPYIVLVLITLVVCFALPAKAYTEGIYTYTVSNGEAAITDCDTLATGSIVIPDSLGGYLVTTIKGYAFYKCTGLTSIEIGDNVVTIGEGAFYKCTDLQKVKLGNNVTSIENDTFRDCANLLTVEAGDSVIRIGDCAFKNCTNLADINLGDQVVHIGNNAFSDCIMLKSIHIGENVTYIGDYAFYNCTSLNNLQIGDGVTYIGNYAFFNTGFYNNKNNWEDCVLYIGKYLIRATAMVVDGKAEYVRQCTIRDGTRLIAPGAFSMCTRLTSVEIPNSVFSIGSEAFEDCTKLTKVDIPDSVKEIGEEAFRGCDTLTSVSLPVSIETIGNYAFYDCYNLQVVYYNGTEEDWGKITIGNNNTLLLNAELITKKDPIEEAIDGTVLTTGTIGEETVIIVPTSINAAMTESDLRAIFNDESIEITSNDGIIGTGCKVTIDEYEVDLVVKGDIDGDGVTTVFDALMVKNALADNSFEDEALREFAGDVDGANGTTESDVSAILSHIVGNSFIE